MKDLHPTRLQILLTLERNPEKFSGLRTFVPAQVAQLATHVMALQAVNFIERRRDFTYHLTEKGQRDLLARREVLA